MKSLKDWNIEKTSVISIAAIFSLIFLMAIFFGVFEELQAWQQMVGAMLSVAATIAITGILLAYQSKQQGDLDKQQRAFELKNEKQTKIFEEKLKIYQDFLDSLYTVLKDGNVTPEEALKLKFKISAIALHTNSNGIVEISEQIENIFQRICRHKERKLRSEEIYLKELLTIVNQFKIELYEGTSYDIDKEFKRAIENFNQIDNAISELPVDVPQTSTQEDTPISIVDSFTSWHSYADQYGWAISSDDNHPLIVSKSNIEMKIERDDNGWYFMVISPFCSRDVYLHIRRLCGGSFISSQCWYLYFASEYKDLNSSQLKNESETNDAFKEYLTNYFLRIVPVLENIIFIKDHIKSKMITNKAEWQSWLYLDDGYCLANDSGTEKKHPFIDVIVIDPQKIRIELSLRDEGEGELHKFLNDINIHDDRGDTSSTSIERWSKEFSSSEDAIKTLNHLIAKIEKGPQINFSDTLSSF